MSRSYEMNTVGGPAPLNYRTKTDLVADVLREEILSGALRAGEPLKQRDVASRLGVSSTPVREALQQLAAQGLVVMDPHRPPTVAMREAERLRENYFVRATLEALAVRLAVDRIGDDELDELEVLNEQLAAAAADDPTTGELNREFHSLLVDAADLPLLSHLIRHLWAALPSGPVARGRTPQESAGQHAELLAALRARDSDRAAQAIEDHILQADPVTANGRDPRPPASS